MCRDEDEVSQRPAPPLAYVKDQMGHSSIQMTVDVSGHLMPGANIGLVGSS